MLCIPAYTVSFSCWKSQEWCTSFAGCGKDRRTGALKAHHTSQDANLRKGAARFGCKQLKRSLVVEAASNAADGVPVKEVAEKKKLLLKYVKDVQPALIEQFVDQGPPAVVAAMRNTITNMLGTLPPQFFTVTISTVGENMSQLMLSVLMTGYMFRSAQYRLELRTALGGMPPAAAMGGSTVAAAQAAASGPFSSSSSSSSAALQRTQSAPPQGSMLDDELYAPGVQKSRVQGDVLLWHKENGVEALDAVSYIEMLEGEVTRLRQQLEQQPQQQQQQPPQPAQQQQQLFSALQQPMLTEGRQLPVPVSAQSALQGPGRPAGPAGGLLLLEEAANELLDYLRCLDAASIAELTGSVGPEVSAAMDSFVARLMGTGDRDSLSRAGSDCTAQELAKVMFWLMVVGYTLRGLEVRWDMAASVAAGSSSSKPQGSRFGWTKDNSHETW
uniref:Uncharacterized protein n=1 Tax=Tetradesmus obliquus TaxID=3088 RepID=A0A383V6W7_TETOB|eukprot:jgi/Sobl393_1/16064/SZX61337.1